MCIHVAAGLQENWKEILDGAAEDGLTESYCTAMEMGSRVQGGEEADDQEEGTTLAGGVSERIFATDASEFAHIAREGRGFDRSFIVKRSAS